MKKESRSGYCLEIRDGDQYFQLRECAEDAIIEYIGKPPGKPIFDYLSKYNYLGLQAVDEVYIEIPKGVATIGSFAFNDSNLPSGIPVKMKTSSTVKYIEDFAFPIELTEIELNDELKTIDSEAFSGTRIESIKLPKGLVYLGAQAFERCKHLKAIEIPKGISTIEHGTFYSCSNLEIAILPILCYIEDYAFGFCEKLKAIVFQGTVSRWNEIEFGEEWNTFTDIIAIHCLEGTIWCKEKNKQNYFALMKALIANQKYQEARRYLRCLVK